MSEFESSLALPACRRMLLAWSESVDRVGGGVDSVVKECGLVTL